ncbi:MAG: hypothetical protein ABMA14_13965 [Hyphomonadaceae bacterium]
MKCRPSLKVVLAGIVGGLALLGCQPPPDWEPKTLEGGIAICPGLVSDETVQLLNLTSKEKQTVDQIWKPLSGKDNYELYQNRYGTTPYGCPKGDYLSSDIIYEISIRRLNPQFEIMHYKLLTDDSGVVRRIEVTREASPTF